METTSQSPIGVLQEVQDQLAALTPDQYIAPTERQEDDAVFVMTAPDSLKRLYTLFRILTLKCEKLVQKGEKKSIELLEYVYNKDAVALITEDADPSSRLSGMKKSLEAVHLELSRTDSLHDILKGIFWLEARRLSPDLRDKSSIGLYEGWALCWRKMPSKGSLSQSIILRIASTSSS